MSGGVDSSAAAAILVEKGYQVVGMMLRLWSEAGREESNRCCTPDAMAQARRVAARLDIPFYAVDARQQFRDVVVESFLSGYASGTTPNPCVICNRQIRWGFLYEQARSLGADYMATGHYARLRKVEDGQPRVELLNGLDDRKDQSYVLSVLTQEQLQHSLFPVGEMQKPAVREFARQNDLLVADRPDSQDLCFLAGEDYREFLKRNIPDVIKPGLIESKEGEVLGEHQGLAFYTIGQRKGLGIAAPQPYYVMEKDLTRNVLLVGEEDELGRDETYADDVNWISGIPIEQPLEGQIKIRYKARKVDGTVFPIDEKRVRIKFNQSLRDITAGQRAVFYKDEVCLGGGTIRD
jgi:tRNA-uridine 2-sulfurtransferase